MNIVKKLIFLFAILLNIFLVKSQNKVKFQLNLQEGNIFNCITKFESIAILGDEQVVKNIVFLNYKLKVLPIVVDSTFNIELKVKDIRYIYDINGDTTTLTKQTIATDSLQEDTLFNNIGKGFDFEISKLGNIISAKNITYQTKKNKKFEAIKLKDIKNILSKLFIKFPQRTLLENDFWLNDDTLQRGLLKYYDTKNTLITHTNDTYIIDVLAKTSSDYKEPKKVNNFFIYYDLKGEQEGTIALNRETCMINTAKIITFSAGTSEMKYSKEGSIAYSSAIKIKEIFSIEIEKK